MSIFDVTQKLKGLKKFYIALLILVIVSVILDLIVKFVPHKNIAIKILLGMADLGVFAAIVTLVVIAAVKCKNIDKQHPDKQIKFQYLFITILYSVTLGIEVIMFLGLMMISFTKVNNNGVQVAYALAAVYYICAAVGIAFYSWALLCITKKINKPIPPEEQETPIQ